MEFLRAYIFLPFSAMFLCWVFVLVLRLLFFLEQCKIIQMNRAASQWQLKLLCARQLANRPDILW